MPELEDRDDLDNEELDNEFDNDIDEDEDQDEEDNELLSTRAELRKAKEALRKANKEAKDRRLQLKTLEKAGLSVDDAVKLREKLEAEEHKRALKRGDVEKIREQLEAKYRDQLSEKDEVINNMKSSLHDYLITNRANEALTSLGAKKGANRVLNPLIQQHTTVVEEDGKYVVRVKDEDGDVRFNDKGDYMSVSEFISEMKSDEVFGDLFQVASASGTGSRPAASQKRVEKPSAGKAKGDMTRAERAAYIRKYGYESAKVDGVPPFSELD